MTRLRQRVRDCNIVDPAQGPITPPEGAVMFDAGGRTIMPELIDAHWHTMMAALPISMLLTRDEVDIHLAAATQAERMLKRRAHGLGGFCLTRLTRPICIDE